MTFAREQHADKRTGVVQLLIGPSAAIDTIGYIDDSGARQFCCDVEVAKLGLCPLTQIGRAVLNTSVAVFAQDVEWDDNTPIQTVHADVAVTQSGVWYAVLLSCLDTTGRVLVSGAVEFVNPFGHLPADLYPALSVSWW